MISDNKDDLIKTINEVSQSTGFKNVYIEKDYYLTMFLSKISELSNNLIFKGGTALSKTYFDYHRMSEDLDFQMRLPNTETITRKTRSDLMKEIKEKIKVYSKQFGINFIDVTAHNESQQYIFMLEYESLIMPEKQTIEIDINLKSNPLLPAQTREINHKFINPFTNQPLIKAGQIAILSFKELLAEKLRAATTRDEIAPRDFYDIDFSIRNNKIDFIDIGFINIFKKKLKQDNKDTDISKYEKNCGRTSAEITKMKQGLNEELIPILNLEDQKNFNIDDSLFRINTVMKNMITAEKE